jgi:1,2-diacylglycerol 3-alpha-glucosyltransferase
VSNGIPSDFRPEAAERFVRRRDRILLLSVGRLARDKRLDVVIEGVRRSRHAARIQLVITGRGPIRAEVVRQAATLPVPGEVSFLSDEDLRRLYNTADLMVHASEVELEGMAVLEAMGCGLPALIADAPQSAARQFAVSPELLFRAGDPTSLAQRLDALIAAPERLQEARARCLRLSVRYSFEESLHQLEAVYRRAVDGARA